MAVVDVKGYDEGMLRRSRLLLPFLLFVPIIAVGALVDNAPEPPATALVMNDADGHDDDERQPESLRTHRLYGVWHKHEPSKLGDPVRFYYFHKGEDPLQGIGLYRFGKLGLNHTHSFTWRITNPGPSNGRLFKGDLHITFNKTGVTHSTKFSQLNRSNGEEVLSFDDDPREPGGGHYVRERHPPPVSLQQWATARTQLQPASAHGFDRMWMNIEKYKTGGMGFRIYQFKEPALDGRGVGWFHQGDFDDWSTEMLTYRKSPFGTGDKLELHFTLRDEHAVSAMRIRTHDGRRAMTVDEDPRHFWHRSVFTDGGRSFAAEHFPSLLH